MHDGVRILDMAIYHPDKVVTNEPYIEHFKKLGIDNTDLLVNVFGRDKRFLIDNTGKKDEEQENSLTMQIEVARRVLKKCGLEGKDMDGVIVATQVPEYLVPPCSMIVHNAIKACHDSFCYDVNSNCMSMIMGLDQAYKYFRCNEKVQRLLIVGGDYQSLPECRDDPTSYGCFGDAACALIMERSKLSTSGYIDSMNYVNHNYIYCNRFPGGGLSKLKTNEAFEATSGSSDCEIPIVIDKIKNILKKNNLLIDNIKAFCFSQCLKKNICEIKESLHIPDEKCPYIGDVYGYTGVSSPFLALYSLVEQGKIKQGDYILFWTLGTGMQHIFELIKY